jgi:hypothetical protein
MLAHHLADTDPRLQRPLAELVTATVTAAGRSAVTQRRYQTALGRFVQYLELERGAMVPADCSRAWCPFATATRDGKRTVWVYRAPVAVLRLVDAPLLDGFRAWREAQGDSPNSALTRLYAVRTFLAVAL